MITAKSMKEIADKVIWEKENRILEQNKDIMQYIEKEIQDRALNGNKSLRLKLTRTSTNYTFPNNGTIPNKEFHVILEKLEREGFHIGRDYDGKSKLLLTIEWKK